jgi:transcriptional regulator GlxA family with amidase domain
MSRHIAFFVIPGFALLDMSGPMCAFEFASRDCEEVYRMTVASETGGLIASSCGLKVHSDPFQPGAYDTVIVVGGPPELMQAAGGETVSLLRAGGAGAAGCERLHRRVPSGGHRLA